jgi:hypothetical protein
MAEILKEPIGDGRTAYTAFDESHGLGVAWVGPDLPVKAFLFHNGSTVSLYLQTDDAASDTLAVAMVNLDAIARA